ncbi:hypothetical protein C2E19_05005 [Pseudomonas sp. DTU12.3]|nr:hypothetical protein C2E19_05005 [Pseudomonas sp. DTU12.3]
MHHHQRFSDHTIDRIFLTHTLSKVPTGLGWKAERERAYRKVTSEWVARVRRRAAKIEEFLEATSAFAIAHCTFFLFTVMGHPLLGWESARGLLEKGL